MKNVIKRPLITEKAMKLGESKQYAFEVFPEANKIEIKKAVEELFDVKVAGVRTANIKGKKTMRYTRRGIQRGSSPAMKKAYVTLKEGSIELVSGVEGEE